MKSRARGSGRRWLSRVAMLLGALLALAVVGELTLRVAPGLSPVKRARDRLKRLQPTHTLISRRIKKEMIAVPATYAPDPYLGALLAPFQHDTVSTPEFTYSRYIDHAGFANRDPWPQHVDAVVLGSSLVMGSGVGIDHRFSTLLSRRFQGRTFLNLGVPGAGPQMEDRIESRFAEPFRPKLVVLAIWLGSDVDNALQFYHWVVDKPARGFTPYRLDYWRTHRYAPSPDPILEFLDRSALWRAAYYTTRALLVRHRMREVELFADGDTAFLSVHIQHRLAQGLARSGTPNMPEVFFGPLKQIQRRVEGRGGSFLVVLLPSKEETYGARAFPPVLNAVLQTRRELRNRKIPFLDLYGPFRRWGTSTSPFFPTDIHYNRLGNRLIANAIGDWVSRQGVFTSATQSHADHPESRPK